MYIWDTKKVVCTKNNVKILILKIFRYCFCCRTLRHIACLLRSFGINKITINSVVRLQSWTKIYWTYTVLRPYMGVCGLWVKLVQCDVIQERLAAGLWPAGKPPPAQPAARHHHLSVICGTRPEAHTQHRITHLVIALPLKSSASQQLHLILIVTNKPLLCKQTQFGLFTLALKSFAQLIYFANFLTKKNVLSYSPGLRWSQHGQKGQMRNQAQYAAFLSQVWITALSLTAAGLLLTDWPPFCPR